MRNIVILSFIVVGLQAASCTQAKYWLVKVMSDKVEPTAVAKDIKGDFSDAPKGYPQKNVQLELFASGFQQITDVQFTVNNSWMFVAEKTGALKVYEIKTKKTKTLASLKVKTDSEMGLLGIALHPKFKENGKFYLNFNVAKGGKNYTHVAEWEFSSRVWDKMAASQKRVLMEVEQPYPNHNAGQLAFGPDGYLYVGFGDGGWADDPHGHGQNASTLLGTMQRLDVATGKYELWTTGLRNPWRYSFDPKNRIVVADVGQNAWEEVSIIDRKGLNLGWNVAEANHCFKPKNCDLKKYQPAVIEYERQLGQSITGGYVITKKGHSLEGQYIYADFASGRMWAAKLPDDSKTILAPSQMNYLGKWPLQIATFGRNAAGEVFVTNFSSGAIYIIK